MFHMTQHMNPVTPLHSHPTLGGVGSVEEGDGREAETGEVDKHLNRGAPVRTLQQYDEYRTNCRENTEFSESSKGNC